MNHVPKTNLGFGGPMWSFAEKSGGTGDQKVESSIEYLTTWMRAEAAEGGAHQQPTANGDNGPQRPRISCYNRAKVERDEGAHACLVTFD